MQLVFCCQLEVGNNVMSHPVQKLAINLMDHSASVLFQFWVEFHIASFQLRRRYFVRPPVAPVVDGREHHLLLRLLVRLIQDVE